MKTDPTTHDAAPTPTPAKRAPGRPRLACDRLRSVSIGVAVTEAEREAFYARAAALGLSASDYGRRLLLAA